MNEDDVNNHNSEKKYKLKYLVKKHLKCEMRKKDKKNYAPGKDNCFCKYLDNQKKTLEKANTEDECSQPEFWTFNAGEGSFHWVTSSCNRNVVIDCGIKAGKNKIKKSIEYFSENLVDLPSLVILTHFHEDHYSHFAKLAERSGMKDQDMTIWVPEIDSYSMALYLRLLAFSSLFANRSYYIANKNLIALFHEKNKVQEKLKEAFGACVVEPVNETKSFEVNCFSNGESKCMVIDVLTPPRYSKDFNNPLHKYLDDIEMILGADGMFEKSQNAIEAMIDEVENDNRFIQYLKATEQTNTFNKDDFSNSILNLIQELPNENEDRLLEESNRLRTMLAIALFSTNQKRIQISGTKDLFPKGIKGKIRDLSKSVKEATHLFNITCRILFDDKPMYLITGDASKQLWPKIFENGGEEYFAVQVPHHGSRDNVMTNVYKKLDSRAFIVSADIYGDWIHPSSKLGDAIRNGNPTRKSNLYCTNEHSNSALCNGKNCGAKDLTAIKVKGKHVSWIQKDKINKAKKCPHI